MPGTDTKSAPARTKKKKPSKTASKKTPVRRKKASKRAAKKAAPPGSLARRHAGTPIYDLLPDAREEQFCKLMAAPGHIPNYVAAGRAGYSWRSAQNQAWRLMSRDEIKRRINGIYKARDKHSLLRKNHAMERLAIIATANPADFLKINELSTLEEIREELQTHPHAAAIKRIRISRNEQPDRDGEQNIDVEIECHSSVKAKEILSNWCAWDRPEQHAVKVEGKVLIDINTVLHEIDGGTRGLPQDTLQEVDSPAQAVTKRMKKPRWT